MVGLGWANCRSYKCWARQMSGNPIFNSSNYNHIWIMDKRYKQQMLFHVAKRIWRGLYEWWRSSIMNDGWLCVYRWHRQHLCWTTKKSTRTGLCCTYDTIDTRVILNIHSFIHNWDAAVSPFCCFPFTRLFLKKISRLFLNHVKPCDRKCFFKTFVFILYTWT